MKSIKTIFTVLLCMTIICVISTSELLYCAHTTLMSPSHFSKFLDKDRNLSKLTALVFSSLTEPATAGSNQAINKYAVNILNKLDRNWIKGQVYIGAAGLQKYIASETTALPTLDFAPLNEVIKETLISEVMKNPQSTENVNKVKTVLSLLNNKYFNAIIKYGLSSQLVPALQKLAPIKSTGFSGTILLEIINVYLSFSNENITIDQASYNIVMQLVEKGLELDKLKAYFDMDLFFETAFGKDNPVLAVKIFVHSMDASLLLLVKVLFCCLILLLFINLRFSLIKFLRAILYCISMATIFNLLLSVLFINPNFSQKILLPFSTSQDVMGGFLIKLWVFLVKDFGFYLALQSIFISFFAVISYLIIISLLKRSSKNKTIKNKTLDNRSFPNRFAVVVVAFVLLFSWSNLYSINKDIKIFQNSLQKLSSIDVNQSILKGLKEAGGMEFLEHLQKK